MSKKTHPAMIGGFVVSGIVLSVVAVLVFGSGRLFERKRSFVSFFPGSVNGLQVGSNVAFRGVTVGTVTEVLLSMDFSGDYLGESMRIPVVFDINENLIQERGVALDLTDEAALRDLMDRGLSASLETESLLTGRLYVALDFRPAQNPIFYGADNRYVEVPTVQSGLAEFRTQLNQLASKFAEADLEALVESVRQTLDGVNGLMTSETVQRLPDNMDRVLDHVDLTLASVRDLTAAIDSTIAPMGGQFTRAADQAEESMNEVDRTLQTLQTVLDPDAPLVVGLVRTLQELELAARSLRRVADLVERDPSVLVRGRETGGGGS